MRNKSIVITVIFMAVLFAVLLSGCGNKETDQTSMNTDENAYVYVAQNVEFPQLLGAYISDVYMVADKLYYTQVKKGNSGPLRETIYSFDMTQEKPVPEIITELPTHEEKEGYRAITIKRVITEDEGSICVVEYYPISDAPSEQTENEINHSDSVFYLKKTDKDSQVIYNIDITAFLKQGDYIGSIQYAVVNDEGYIFLSDGFKSVWVFSEKGEYIADAPLNVDWANGIYVQSFGTTNDGRAAYIMKDTDKYTLYVYDKKRKDFTEVFSNLPDSCQSTPLTMGVNQGILITGKDALFEYDPSKQKYRELTQWLDVDVQIDYVTNTYSLSNGDIVVFMKNPEKNENSVVLLKRMLASEVKLKKTIVLSGLGIPHIINDAIVEFNKNNEDYRIVIKDYYSDLNYSSISIFTDEKVARQKFQMDMATGQGADLFIEYGADTNLLVQKGIIEDLAPYLDQSQVIKRSDFIEPALRAYEINGILCAIPYDFIVRTFIGRKSDLGESTHWTLEEMIDYAYENPDSNPYLNINHDLFISDMVDGDMASFVNWEKGECYFDTKNFKDLLELSKTYPSFEELMNTPSLICYDFSDLATRKALLCYSVINTPYSLHQYKRYFNEPITVIGYPTANTDGVYLNSNTAISINAASQNKEGAWAFFEYLFTNDPELSVFTDALPSKKNLYDQMMLEAVTPTYVTEADGSLSLDENGDPILKCNFPYNGRSVTEDIFYLSQEDVDETWEIINRNQGIGLGNSQVMDIILEEVAPYYLGQKTLDEVVDIIQSRVSIYVKETK